MFHPRHKVHVLLLTVTLISLLAGGCKGPEASDISLTEADNGTSITVKKGQVVSIDLPARPTRGERWDPEDLAVYDKLPMGRERFTPDSGLADYDGYQTLRFEAKTRGTYDLKLIYRVVGEEGGPISTFELTLTVE